MLYLEIRQLLGFCIQHSPVRSQLLVDSILCFPGRSYSVILNLDWEILGKYEGRIV